MGARLVALRPPGCGGMLRSAGSVMAVGGAVALACCADVRAQAQVQGAGGAGASTPVSAAAAGGRWLFEVTLDGKPIGRHRFDVVADAAPAAGPDAWTVRSEARYDVTLLGVPLYRYRHEADEQWRAGCLQRLRARTDDNGERLSVQADADAGRLQVRAVADGGRDAAAAVADPGCVAAYSYWRPDFVRQPRLLSPQTGRIEDARFTPVGAQTLRVDGQPVAAQGWQLSVGGKVVVVWYAPTGRWVGLDANVAGGRQLRYRLNAAGD